MTDASNVLVAYASEHGSTGGVAKRIAARLGEREAHVEVRPVIDVDGVGGYHAVVLGSGLYHQRWIPRASAITQPLEHAGTDLELLLLD